MKNQNFGIEIELTGITREEAAKVMAKQLGTNQTYFEGGGYSTWVAVDSQGRKWKAMRDGSITTETRNGRMASTEYSCEIVSPICTYEDIETIQEIVRMEKGKKC